MKKFVKILGLIMLMPIILLVAFLIYSTAADYKPEPVEQLFNSHGKVVNVYDTLSIFNWNIGYCGLGDDMSFFYDGGDKVRTTKERVVQNLEAVKTIIKSNDSIDFYLLQEVDLSSRRSYKTNQLDSIINILPTFHADLGLNYKVPFVPVPVNNPLGKVYSGMVSFSKYKPFLSSRHSFPGNYVWPKVMFMLDRCFMVQRFYASNGKELLIVNTHNSAYDDGTLRKQQMEVLKSFLISEYEKGNYLLVGGDWNQNAPVIAEALDPGKEGRLTRIRIAYDFMPEGWEWQYTEDIPTNRMINEPYNPEITVTNTIDFYLTSPNIKVIAHRNIDLQFKNSDHNPVVLSFVFVR